MIPDIKNMILNIKIINILPNLTDNFYPFKLNRE